MRFGPRAGDAGYTETFVEHYIVPLVYPEGLTPQTQLVLGVGIVALNAAIYALAWRKSRRGAGCRARNPALHMTRSVQ